MEKNNVEEYVPERVTLCNDGKYRWIYRFDMLKNPVILFTIWRVLGMAFFIVWAFAVIIGLIGNDIDMKSFIDVTRGFFLIALFMCALGAVAYLIVAGQYGWRYIVVFEMDEKTLVHRQLKSQFDKAKTMGLLTALIGAATGDLAMAGQGLINATRDSLSTDFDKVKKVKISKLRHTIFINAPFSHNQVYISEEDFEFVKQFILDHIPEEVSKRVR